MFILNFACIIIISLDIIQIFGLECGDPGRPAYGRAIPITDTYSEGQSVSYACDSGYYMVGPILRRCLPNGTWTGDMPVCDTTLSPVGYTSASESLSLYPPELAVDGNKRTCYYSNRRTPRWWRMDMGQRTTVISVSITVPFAMSEQHFTIYLIEINGTVTKYHKCASFKGVFSSQAMILVCAGKGVTGQLLHIEDNFHVLDYFGLCEVEVFIHKDVYECGKPETPTNSYYHDRNHHVEYGCNDGFKLEGHQFRWCLKNGQWSGSQPICREMICPRPERIENGFYRIVGKENNKPLLGSKMTIICKTGYNINGNDTRICGENGFWSGHMPQCQPVDCGIPPFIDSPYLGGRLKLINGSTKYQSIAELICFSGKIPGIRIYCRDDGTWSQLEATCIPKNVNYLYGFDAHLSEAKSMGSNTAVILSSIIAAVLFLLIIIVFILFKKKILQLKWTSEPRNDCSLTPSTRRSSSWAIEALRKSNFKLRKPFSFGCKLPIEKSSNGENTNDSPIKSNSSKLENIYEEIAAPTIGTLSAENAEKIKKAAMIAAEIAAVTEKKRASAERSVIAALYAKIDYAQKRRQRLEKDFDTQTNDKSQRLRKTASSPVPIYALTSASSSSSSSNDDHHIYAVNPINRKNECDNCVNSVNGNESASQSDSSVLSVDKEVYGLH